jgi:hypothetical protein
MEISASIGTAASNHAGNKSQTDDRESHIAKSVRLSVVGGQSLNTPEGAGWIVLSHLSIPKQNRLISRRMRELRITIPGISAAIRDIRHSVVRCFGAVQNGFLLRTLTVATVRTHQGTPERKPGSQSLRSTVGRSLETLPAGRRTTIAGLPDLSLRAA